MKLKFFVLLSMLLCGDAVYAQGTLNGKPRVLHRCTADNLDPEMAQKRLGWLYKCIRKNGGDFFGITEVTFMTLTMDILSDGRYVAKPNPYYPLFIDKDTQQVVKVYPTAPAERNQLENCTVPGNVEIVKYCQSSCYTADQRISFTSGDWPILFAIDEMVDYNSLLVLKSGSSIDNIQFRSASWTPVVEAVDVDHELVVIKTMSGGVLEVTTNHPLVNQDGVMVEAGSLTTSDSLALVDLNEGAHPDDSIPADLLLDPIVEIEEKTFFGKVYNVQPELNLAPYSNEIDATEQIVIAEGFLSGSNWYQNDGAKNMNRELVRINIPADLL